MNKHTVLSLLVLLCIVMLGLTLRLYQLGSIPYGSLIDESHFGFIARSLLLTGKDEHGTAWPLVFKGFGDYKLPMYAYSLMPFVKFFDLSVMTIRLPSALAGTVSIVLVYFFILGLFPHKRGWAVFGAGIMAISPWPFLLSRFGFESNVALMWWLFALNGIVRLRNHWGWAALAGLSAGLTWYSYIAYRPVTSILLFLWIGFLWWEKSVSRKTLSLLLAGFLVVAAPITLFASESNVARVGQVGLLADDGIAMTVNDNRNYCVEHLPKPWCYLVYNKGVVIAQTVSTRWLSTVSSDYLFTQGEPSEKYLRVEGFGQFAVILVPLFFFGFFAILVGHPVVRARFVRVLLVSGLIVAPLPALLVGDPQKVRLSPLLPFVLVTMVIGGRFALGGLQRLLKTYSHRTQQLVEWGVVLGFLFLWVINSLLFFTSFYSLQMFKNGHMYQSYVRDMMHFLTTKYQAGATVYFRPIFSDPIMFFAFYSKMDPALYQRTAVLGQLEDSGFQHTDQAERLFMTNKDLLDVACKAVLANQPTYYVTDVAVNPPAQASFLATADNGVLTYAYVYDALLYGKVYVDRCLDIPDEVKATIMAAYQAEQGI